MKLPFDGRGFVPEAMPTPDARLSRLAHPAPPGTGSRNYRRFARSVSAVPLLLIAGTVALFTLIDVQGQAQTAAGLQNSVVLVIRHGEKPDKGKGLSKAGERRAKAYVKYFSNYTVDSSPFKPNLLYSAADSNDSQRPRLTLEPFSKAVGLPINSQFPETKGQALANAIRALSPGNQILICWHHGEIPDLLRALGAEPSTVIPGNKWPDDVFDWVIQLRYDTNGQVMEAKRIEEKIKVKK